jgi:hypothetical protein
LKGNNELIRMLASLKGQTKKKREVNVPMPRVYFFFAGAFFSSFLTGFLATEITSGFNV